MKLDDLGFHPVIGQTYVVTFTADGKLVKTMEYNGTPFDSLVFPNNSKVTLSVTDKLTGKEVYSNVYYEYNGHLYAAVFALPLRSQDTAMNANVYIKDLHYDLASGSILVGVQGFNGESYSLTVADATVNQKILTLPITLQDNTYYSLATSLVQGNRFQVTLYDSHGQPLDQYDFTAPLTTGYRYTDSQKDTQNTTAPTQQQTQPPKAQDQNGQTKTGPTIQQTQTQGQTSGVTANNTLRVTSNPSPFEVIGLGLLLLTLFSTLLIVVVRRKRRAREEFYVDEEEPDLESEDSDSEHLGDIRPTDEFDDAIESEDEEPSEVVKPSKSRWWSKR